MSNKDEFKLFVKVHPELIRYVKTDEMTWQKFYEIFSLYGKDNEVWNTYFNKDDLKSNIKSQNNDKFSLSEFIDMAKKLDLDALQNNITNINKGLALIESLITKDTTNINNNYTPRPLYKKFED